MQPMPYQSTYSQIYCNMQGKCKCSNKNYPHWSVHQDIALLKMVLNLGCKPNWKQITNFLKPRSQDGVMQRYLKLLSNIKAYISYSKPEPLMQQESTKLFIERLQNILWGKKKRLKAKLHKKCKQIISKKQLINELMMIKMRMVNTGEVDYQFLIQALSKYDSLEDENEIEEKQKGNTGIKINQSFIENGNEANKHLDNDNEDANNQNYSLLFPTIKQEQKQQAINNESCTYNYQYDDTYNNSVNSNQQSKYEYESELVDQEQINALTEFQHDNQSLMSQSINYKIAKVLQEKQQESESIIINSDMLEPEHQQAEYQFEFEEKQQFSQINNMEEQQMQEVRNSQREKINSGWILRSAPGFQEFCTQVYKKIAEKAI